MKITRSGQISNSFEESLKKLAEEKKQVTAAERITPEEAEIWTSIADKLKKASALVDEAHLDMIMKLNVTEGNALARLDDVRNDLSGLPYLFSVQHEWTGGDSKNPQNHVPTKPHIARP